MKKILLIAVIILFGCSINVSAQNLTLVNKSKKFNIKAIYIGRKLNNTDGSPDIWTKNLLKNELIPGNALETSLKKPGEYFIKVIWVFSNGYQTGDKETFHVLGNITNDTYYYIKYNY